jgi:hypothetical protein
MTSRYHFPSTDHSNKKFCEELIAYFRWYDTGHIENDASNNSSIVGCVFVTAVTFLPSRCVATVGRFLPSRFLATIREFLASRCLATIEGIHRHTHRQQRDIISLLYFLKVRLKSISASHRSNHTQRYRGDGLTYVIGVPVAESDVLFLVH